MSYIYTPKGVCSRKIYINMDGDKILSVQFEGGCSGNTSGLSKMVEGLKAQEVIDKLKGIKCGSKNTSCPDQLATALEEILNKKDLN